MDLHLTPSARRATATAGSRLCLRPAPPLVAPGGPHCPAGAPGLPPPRPFFFPTRACCPWLADLHAAGRHARLCAVLDGRRSARAAAAAPLLGSPVLLPLCSPSRCSARAAAAAPLLGSAVLLPLCSPSRCSARAAAAAPLLGSAVLLPLCSPSRCSARAAAPPSAPSSPVPPARCSPPAPPLLLAPRGLAGSPLAHCSSPARPARPRPQRDGRPTPSKWVGVVRSIWADHSDPHLRGIYLFGAEPNPHEP
ncbi:wiskott-Aldrich syndrome protein homolog 1-like [Panicum virgatum]|uniref:wiskott-Aldrich syndrome protein homolog 1-like n=1 Tax=Panicum virgatum TaxID=38727 RepID=UPI0019D5604A|nr:wiskott-Aldrich syndrome protein homolog 1-like [Panicum virgatum]